MNRHYANEDRSDSPDPGIAPPDEAVRRGWVRVAVALVLAGQGMAFGLAANMTPPAGAAYWVMHGGLALSAVAVFWLLGGPLLRESAAGLRAGRMTVDQLFLVTLTGAFAVSTYSTFRREGPVFYELVAILLAIYSAGKLVGARSRARALSAVGEVRREHDFCTVIEPDGKHRRVRVSEVEPGRLVFIAAGEVVGVDGCIRQGRGLVWTTPLTGEPTPRLFGPGDELLAGMRSVDAAFTLEVTAAEGKRRLDGMLASIEQARLAPSRLQAHADRLAARFVPLVILVSLGTMVGWYVFAGLHAAIVNGLAVLVVACPCALGLATPLGVWSGLVALGQLGIVARTGEFIERLAGANVAFFDKTGTLCEPELIVAGIEFAAEASVSESEMRQLIVIAEHAVDHPIASALRKLETPGSTGATGGSYALVEGRMIPGFGIEATVRREADARVFQVRIGTADEHAEAGPTPTLGRTIAVTVDGAPAARILLAERPYEIEGRVFRDLGELGVYCEILTGDPQFGETLWPGVARRTGMSPEAKAAAIRDRQEAGETVLFVGDGLNDAPGLARADASIAILHGTDLARGSAMAVTHGKTLGTLADAVRVARKVRAAIRGNLRFAALYNTVGMGIAAAGWLHPVLAALLMAGSSLLVSSRVLAAASIRHPVREDGFGV